MSKTFYPYKPQSMMSGPHALTRENVLRFVPRSFGVYLLSNPSAMGVPLVRYVGRSADLEGRLLDHVQTGYQWFYYREASSEHDAYAGECNEFHRYGGTTHLDNEIHPAKPTIYTQCPVCGA